LTEPYVTLATICARNGVTLDQDQMTGLRGFVDLLLDWNTRINLVSRADIENIWFSHILHSISPLFFVHFDRGVNILDLGSGGGLPGIPIAIARRDLSITCIDSIRKKTAALENIIVKLGLPNVSVVSGRAEDLTPPEKAFDVIIARAVAPLSDLIRWSRSVLGPGHRPKRSSREDEAPKARMKTFNYPFLLAMKGGDLSSEIEKAKITTGEENISSIDIVFEGSTEIGLEEKKMVVVEFPGR
jgi:16S rRNA (guanine527-N7)-methyltransferase